MNHTSIATLFCVFGFPLLIVRADGLPDGADIFIEAVRYRVENHTLVHSLFYVAEQTYRIPTLSEAEIEKEADETEAQLRRAFKNDPNAHLWLNEAKEYERRESLRKHYMQGSVLSRLTVKYKAPNFSRKLLSLQIERQSQGRDGRTKWEMGTHVIEANVVSNKSESEGVVWFPPERSAHVNNTQAYRETLLRFGRLQGPPVMFMQIMLLQGTDIEKYEFSEKNIAKFKDERNKQSQSGKARLLQTVGTVTYDGDAKAYIVQTFAGDKVVERYWIDINRGYVCPLLQYYDEKGKLLSEYKSEDYFLHEKSGLWFPQLYKETTTGQDGKQEYKEYRLDPSSVDVNFPIAEDEFLVDIPEGAKVIDSRKGKGTKRYMALDKGVLSLGKGGLDLEKMDWLAATEISNESPKSFVFVQVLSIIVGILLIFYGLYLRFHRKS